MDTKGKTKSESDACRDVADNHDAIADNNDEIMNVSRRDKHLAKHQKQYDEHRVNNQRARDDYFLALSSNFAPAKRDYYKSPGDNDSAAVPITMHARNISKRFDDRSDLELYGMHLEADYRCVGRPALIIPFVCFVSYMLIVAVAIIGYNDDLLALCKYIVYVFLTCAIGIFVIWTSGIWNPYKRELRRRGTMKKAGREWDELQWNRVTAEMDANKREQE